MRTAVQETSIDAFHSHECISIEQRERILNFIVSRGGDWTIGEIAYALNMQKSTVSARINELLNKTCDLEERPRRKDRISNIMVRPVGIRPNQGVLFQ